MDGVSPEVLFGCDYFAEYEDLGHQLFCDADKFQDRFIAADVLDESRESPLEKTSGSWDVINIFMFLHIYDWPTQLRVCKRILKLLVKKKGSMVIGAQIGSTQAGNLHLKPPFVTEGEERIVFRQNLETFKQMWETVGDEQGVQLKIGVEYDNQQDIEARAREEQEGGKQRFFSGSEQRRLFFTVTIE